MPTYEFHCTACDCQFQQKWPFEQASQPAPCPKCGAQSVKKLSGFTFVMK
jgi:putative FmdB family regulatory protein